MDTGPEGAVGDVDELDPCSGFELRPQPVIIRAIAATKTENFIFIVRRSQESSSQIIIGQAEFLCPLPRVYLPAIMAGKIVLLH
jgi:hypothetical protein